MFKVNNKDTRTTPVVLAPPAITYSKLTIEALEEGLKYV